MLVTEPPNREGFTLLHMQKSPFSSPTERRCESFGGMEIGLMGRPTRPRLGLCLCREGLGPGLVILRVRRDPSVPHLSPVCQSPP